MSSITTDFIKRRQVALNALWFAMALILVLRFILRQSFEVPAFVYQNF
jgi:hypothetical protein